MRHHLVDKQQIVGPSGVGAQQGAPLGKTVRLNREPRQLLLQHQQIRRMIVDDGDAQRGVAGQDSVLLRRGLAALQRQRHRHVGASAGLRAQRDVAAHALHNLPADKQPQPAALHRYLFAGRRLIPGIEQLRLLFRRNAAAAVAQSKYQPFVGGERQAYLALGREFQRIGHQVIDHLL